MRFASVNEFVASLGLNCIAEANDQPKKEDLWPRNRFDICEIVRGELDVLAEEAQAPRPGERSSDKGGPKRVMESFIGEPGSFTDSVNILGVGVLVRVSEVIIYLFTLDEE